MSERVVPLRKMPLATNFFHVLLGEDFEFLVNDQHHVLSVRDMVKAVSFLDGTLEAEGEDELFDEL